MVTNSFIGDDGYGDDMSTGRKGSGDGSFGISPGSNKRDIDSSGDEHHALIKRKKKVEDRMPTCYGLRRFFGWVISREKRVINLNGRVRPSRFPTNRQNNQKYNVITLIPVVLFNQFKFFYNFFFLVIALSQFIPALKVGFLITYIAPLAFVLAVTIVKECFDDFQRMRKDSELNNKKYL